jgi:hypothetical protein
MLDCWEAIDEVAQVLTVGAGPPWQEVVPLRCPGLVGRPSRLNELIARNIIELATCGVHDAERLSAGVLAIYRQAAE